MDIIRQWDYNADNPPPKINFKNKNISLEIGCGNGLFLSTISSLHPQNTFIGLEIKHKCMLRAQKKCQILVAEGKILDENIILINGDIFTAVDTFFEQSCLDNIYINFPDPWFKERHLKKRVVNPDMAIKYANLLKTGGHIYFVTDNEDYKEYGVDCLAQCNLLEPIFSAPHYVQQLDWYPKSLYEQKWRDAGRNIYYSGFTKK